MGGTRKGWVIGVTLALAFLAAAPRARGEAPELERALAAAPAGPALPAGRDVRAEARRLYADRGGAFLWLRDGAPTPQALALVALLQDASAKGLDPADYDGPRWAERLARPSGAPAPPAEAADLEAALTLAALRYLSDLQVGRVSPRRARFALDVDGERDLTGLLAELAASGEPAAVAASLEPPFAAYRRTLGALQAYRALARDDDGARLAPAARPVSPGQRYPGVARLARLLRRVGDLAPGAPAEGDRYAGELVEAVRRFQRRHGIEPSGSLDAGTLRALDTPLARRVVQLELTLERWRWLPRRFEAPPVVVNIPEFRLRARDPRDGRAVSMKVVVGRAYGHETPVFTSAIGAIAFRPSWTVPHSIARDELAPGLRRDPDLLARGGYDLLDAGGAPVEDPGDAAETARRLRAGTWRLRQRPGAHNALGLVKFVMPNAYDVYLHGTPARQLFARSRRDFSHGCIRVEDPLALAAWALRDRPEWTPARPPPATEAPRSSAVQLTRPIPVLILYGTALVAEDGEVRFLDDIYGHDALLEQALAERRLLRD